MTERRDGPPVRAGQGADLPATTQFPAGQERQQQEHHVESPKPSPRSPAPRHPSGRWQDYPAGRPDFEPPPPWARPIPRNASPPPPGGGPQLGPKLGPAPPPAPGGRWQPRRAVLVALAVTIALVAAAAGASAGVLATLRFGPALISTEPPEPEDDLGSTGSALPKPSSVAEVADALLPSVVQIKVSSTDGNTGGSGFVIRADGYILTNNHVVAPAVKSGGTITIVFHDGEEARASVVGRSPSYDLAVVRVKGVGRLKPVALGDSDRVRVGEPVVALGSPLGLAGTVTSGIVSARNRPVTAGGGDSEMSFINAIQTDAAVNPGNSGGPLVNLRAQVVGVNSAIATVGERGPFRTDQQEGNIGVGFSIPVNQARRTADQIIKTGRAVYPVVGAVVDVRHQGPGARLGEIQPGSAADKAGLRRGDVVTMINGHKVAGADDLIVRIRSYVPGQRVELVYNRGGKTSKVIVTLGEETG